MISCMGTIKSFIVCCSCLLALLSLILLCISTSKVAIDDLLISNYERFWLICLYFRLWGRVVIDGVLQVICQCHLD